MVIIMVLDVWSILGLSFELLMWQIKDHLGDNIMKNQSVMSGGGALLSS